MSVIVRKFILNGVASPFFRTSCITWSFYLSKARLSQLLFSVKIYKYKISLILIRGYKLIAGRLILAMQHVRSSITKTTSGKQ